MKTISLVLVAAFGGLAHSETPTCTPTPAGVTSSSPDQDFVIALQKTCDQIVAELGKETLGFDNAWEQGSKCYLREETMETGDKAVKGVAAHYDRKNWRRFRMKAAPGSWSPIGGEHNVGCYVYGDQKNPQVEIAVDSWKGIIESSEQWWKDTDSKAHDGLQKLCGGKGYCGECACVYASYYELSSAGLTKDAHWQGYLTQAFNNSCPDSPELLQDAFGKFGPAMQKEFGPMGP